MQCYVHSRHLPRTSADFRGLPRPSAVSRLLSGLPGISRGLPGISRGLPGILRGLPRISRHPRCFPGVFPRSSSGSFRDAPASVCECLKRFEYSEYAPYTANSQLFNHAGNYTRRRPFSPPRKLQPASLVRQLQLRPDPLRIVFISSK